ncbi:MAG: phenylalanine--tRNA ligase subunit beta [Proteobacteria bacterium]|nr:phenylalanine--tRNA ligase subunit beta [Pseudomonadota bacterium]
MPIVAVSVKRLNDLLGREFTRDDLVDSLEQLGCDVEDTAELGIYLCPVCQTPNDKLTEEDPPKRCDFCGYESTTPFERVAVDRVIRLDLLAARPDLFDVGGLSRALKGYLGLEKGLNRFPVGESGIEVNIDPIMSEADTFRPFIVCALVEMPPLDHNSLRDIMKLQENLHWGIGRDRKLASIGIYNMDVLKPPISYSAVDPVEFKFCPLGMSGSRISPKEILEVHPKGMAYAHLMTKYRRYPILQDAEGQVLSMPPIINSEETKLTVGSTRLFVDITGLTRNAVVKSLDTLVSSMAELGGKIKTVRMNHPDKTATTPDLSPGTINIKYEEAKRWLGIEFTRQEFVHYLEKMRLDVEPEGDGYLVSYPAFRTDIKHEVDVFEDLAIGYGFKNIQPRLIPNMTIGNAREEEVLSQMVRAGMLGLGFTEVMSLLLESEERQFRKHRLEPANNHVVVENPKTIEQKVIRSHMMTGIMETFQKNRRKAVPQKIFEIGNVIHLQPDKETGTAEYRHLAFAIVGPEAGYAEGRAVMDAVLHEIHRTVEYRADSYPSFSDGRCALIDGEQGTWGRLGEIHPQVLTNFGLSFPVVYGELRLKQVI